MQKNPCREEFRGRRKTALVLTGMWNHYWEKLCIPQHQQEYHQNKKSRKGNFKNQ